MMAEKMFHLPIFYLEYSGKYGDPTVVEAAKENLENTVLFYGGGIEIGRAGKRNGTVCRCCRRR